MQDNMIVIDMVIMDMEFMIVVVANNGHGICSGDHCEDEVISHNN